MREAYFCRISC